jgi:LmbE family N-acetylglucosaminyl deacetylase
VTAHADDESLWFAGVLLRYPGSWTIICCSVPTRDPIRAYKFFDACEALGARGRLLPLRETLDQPLTQLHAIDLSSFDLVVSHGEKGEYGHPHHKQLHKLVKAKCAGRMLASAYGSDQHASELVLTDAEWAGKLEALKSYDHEMNFGGHVRPTWEALIAEYGTPGQHKGFDLRRERYVQH